MTVRLLLVTHLMTAATRRGAFPLDESIESARPLPALVRPGSLAVRGPETRCAQMATALRLECTVSTGLADWNLGRWAGRTLHEVTADEPDAVSAWVADPAAAPHGGETLDELVARATGWLDTLADQSVVALTHPAVVRAVLVGALGVGSVAFWRLDIAPGTATTLSGRHDRWNVSQMAAALHS